jgi:DNA-binding transcriptional MerR regulator
MNLNQNYETGIRVARKYKYMFRFPHGSEYVDLFGSSIFDYVNDIYDAFDIDRVMIVERLDEKAFSLSEIKRLFRDLAYDMDDDLAEIGLEILNKGRKLRFIEINNLNDTSLEELKEINEKHLEKALENFQNDALKEKEEVFTNDSFKVYLGLVKNAKSNAAKKDTLEHLSRYLLNGVKGFRVIDKNCKGPSEEIDLLVANESIDPPLRSIGNPIAIECRHRKIPATSKDIRDFEGKLSAMCLSGGILITLKGVTGNRYDAVGVIRDARKKGTSIIVIALDDLEKILEGKTPDDVLRDCFYKYV